MSRLPMYDPATLLPMFADGLPLACLAGVPCCEDVVPRAPCAEASCLDAPLPPSVTVTISGVTCPADINGTHTCTLGNVPALGWLDGCSWRSDIKPTGLQILTFADGWRDLYYVVNTSIFSATPSPNFNPGSIVMAASARFVFYDLGGNVDFSTSMNWGLVVGRRFVCHGTHQQFRQPHTGHQLSCGMSSSLGSSCSVTI